MFEGLPAAAEWDAFCRTALEEEIQKQVLPDGADFESSLPYHRLVARHRGAPLLDAYLGRLRAMMQVVFDVMRPDGLLAPVSLLLSEPAWLAQAGPGALWEANKQGLNEVVRRHESMAEALGVPA